MTCTATSRRSRRSSTTPRGADRFVLGGDYALFGGWPKETVERLRALPDALWIRGNGERWTANPQRRAGQPDRPAGDRGRPRRRSARSSWPTSPRCRPAPPAATR